MRNDPIERAIQMLNLAAEWARDNVVIGFTELHYDGADCDGYCLADDCENAAEALRSLTRAASPNAQSTPAEAGRGKGDRA